MASRLGRSLPVSGSLTLALYVAVPVGQRGFALSEQRCCEYASVNYFFCASRM